MLGVVEGKEHERLVDNRRGSRGAKNEEREKEEMEESATTTTQSLAAQSARTGHTHRRKACTDWNEGSKTGCCSVGCISACLCGKVKHAQSRAGQRVFHPPSKLNWNQPILVSETTVLYVDRRWLPYCTEEEISFFIFRCSMQHYAQAAVLEPA